MMVRQVELGVYCGHIEFQPGGPTEQKVFELTILGHEFKVDLEAKTITRVKDNDTRPIEVTDWEISFEPFKF